MAAANTTKPTGSDVTTFLEAVPDERRRADAIAVNDLFAEVTGAQPAMWGSSMVGYGRSGEYFAVGFAPRKAALTLYGLTYDGSNADLLDRLGPHTTGKGCLYVKRLAELDRDVLSELVRRSYTANHTG